MPPPSTQRRRGFTLIELLVVIAIIAVLIGLLLPAVQKVREAAARTKCQNNLKQIALGAHMYQSTYQKLPTGVITDATGIPGASWSWATLLMPYIEQKNLYDNLPNTGGGAGVDTKTPNYPAAAAGYLTAKVSLYRCPSDVMADQNTNFGGYGTVNYVCNREVLGPGRVDGSAIQDGLSVERIPDGSSNTILFGERDGDRNVGAILIHAGTGGYTASFEGRPGYGINPKIPASSTANAWTTSNNESYAYSSAHTGGSQFAMGDGRVIFINEQIDADPNDSYLYFPACVNAGTPACTGGKGVKSPFTLQLMQHPNDRLPVVIP